MIDLRSDTVTVPTPEMRKAIAEAVVGDDVFGDDPTVNELQGYVAGLLGKEAALYVPSGTMANQISIAIQTKPGEEAIVEADSHIFIYEAGAPASLSGVQLRCIRSGRGIMPEEEIKNAIRSENDHFPRTSLICIENTHNRHGGSVIPLDYIKRVRAIADENNISMHCDGARLWNASAATGISPAEYAAPFDTVSVCFSKALGAPVGSIIASTGELIYKARRRRKALGGGMRQAGIIAAGALFAVKNHLEHLKEDHNNARLFAERISESSLIILDLSHIETNIVIFGVDSRIDPGILESECEKSGLRIIAIGNNSIRAVFHFQINQEQTIEAAEILINIAEKLAL